MPRKDIDPWKALEFIANGPLGIGDTSDCSEAVLGHDFAEFCV